MSWLTINNFQLKNNHFLINIALGTGVCDFIRLIFTGVNADLRQKHLDEWKKLYFDTFQAQVKKLKNNQKIKTENNFNEIQSYSKFNKIFNYFQHYELCFALNLFVCVIYSMKICDKSRENIIKRFEQLFEDQKHLYQWLILKIG